MEKYINLACYPSGIVRKNKVSIIGNGVVIDPWALVSEMDRIRAQGVDITPDNLIIAEKCPADLARCTFRIG